MIIKISYLILILTSFLNFGICKLESKILNIKYLAEYSSHAVKELSVHGLENVTPSIEEAKKSIRELFKINEINMIKDEIQRNDAWAENLKLKQLEGRLRLINTVSYLQPDFQHKVLDSGDLLETMVHLSMLDTLNKKSPFYGKNYDSILKSIKEEEVSLRKLSGENSKSDDQNLLKHKQKQKYHKETINLKSEKKTKKIPKCNKPKHKFIRNNRAMRLMFSKIIAPGQKLPDSHRVVFTDKRGRTCYCSC